MSAVLSNNKVCAELYKKCKKKKKDISAYIKTTRKSWENKYTVKPRIQNAHESKIMCRNNALCSAFRMMQWCISLRLNSFHFFGSLLCAYHWSASQWTWVAKPEDIWEQLIKINLQHFFACG